VRFETDVVSVEPQPDERWRITVRPGADESHDVFDAVNVANGHHWYPRLPSYPGVFRGTMMHSHEFKRAAPFAVKRVLVIGGANSACDVAVETEVPLRPAK
jgi:cation diffusion facilitator CzcD-associated flavoprotein CzcO